MAAGSIIVDLLMRTGSFETDTKRAEKSLQRMAKEARASAAAFKASFAGNLLSDLTQRIGSALGRLPGEVLAALDAFNDLKDATGASIENISAVDRVARETGVDFEIVETALVKLNQALNSAKPDSDAERALRAIGLSAKELKGIDPAEALHKVAIALAGFADDGNKARLIQELLGKSAKELAPLLVDLAKQGTLVASTTTAQAEEAEKLRKQLFELSADVQDIARSLMTALMPALIETVKQFKELFGGAKAPSTLSTEIGLLETNLAKLRGLEGKGFTVMGFFGSEEERAAEIKKIEQQLIDARDKFAAATGGGGRGNLALMTQMGPKPSVGDLPDKKEEDKKEKPKKAAVTEAEQYLENLQKQVDATNQLTTAEQLLSDIQSGRLKISGKVTQDQLMAAARAVDEAKNEVELRRMREDAMVELRNERIKAGEAAMDEARALEEDNKALEEEIKLMGASAETTKALEKARVDSALTLARDKLARIEAADALGIETWALRDQIAALERRAQLLTERDATEQFIENQRRMQEAALEARDTFEGTLGQGLEEVLNGNFKNIGDLFQQMLNRMIAASLAANLTKMMFGASSGGDPLGGLLNLFSGVFTGSSGFSLDTSVAGNTGGITSSTVLPDILRGGRAGGGDVHRGGVYPVGEKGPELFVPSTSGRIIPNSALGRGPGTGKPERAINVTLHQAFAPNATRATVDQAAAAAGTSVRRALARTR